MQSSAHAFVHINGRQLVESPTVPSTVTISDSGDSTKALRLGYEPTWDAASIAASDYGAGWKNILIAPVGSSNIGIGTTNPDAKLSIVNTAGIVGMNLKAAADNICYIDFGDSSDNNIGGINYSNNDDNKFHSIYK